MVAIAIEYYLYKFYSEEYIEFIDIMLEMS